MERVRVLLLILVAVLGLSDVSNADLLDRGGGLIYDEDQNITWLQDANYAETSGYDANGIMNWPDAVAWAEQLTYGGYNDWRLPTTVDGVYEWGITGYTTGGYYITSSEMGYMYYENLGNLGAYERYKGPWPDGTTWGLENTGPFINLLPEPYWSGTEYGNEPLNAWFFNFSDGEQLRCVKDFVHYRAWAVRDGDVDPVPIPGAVWLLGSGLVGLIGIRRRIRF